jgi:xylulokinase
MDCLNAVGIIFSSVDGKFFRQSFNKIGHYSMANLLGIDLGTSSVKAVVIDENADVIGLGQHEYPIQSPQSGWAEQNPQIWWEAVVIAVRQAVSRAGVPISTIGLSGQMHGIVLIDSDAQAVGSAIIWADQRSTAEVDEIITRIGRERIVHIAGTAPATGFMASTLLWLLHHDPSRFDRAAACLLPKDYIRLRLTGNAAAEVSDASATALFDIRARQWSDEIVSELGLPRHLLPLLLESSALAGQLQSTAAEALGLPSGIPVVAGCADQVAQAVGNNLLNPGDGSVTLGSGGQLFMPLAQPLANSNVALHNFCHAPSDRWYLLGAMLTAGLSFRWLRDLLSLTGDSQAYPQLAALAADVPPGADGLLFLPYLAGERSPLMDSLARGCFIGLTLRHERGHLARAIMEGVAFALRHILDSMIASGTPVNHLLAAGNGLSSPIWRQIVVDILAHPLYQSSGEERTAVGAALVAGIGTGVYGAYGDLQHINRGEMHITEPITANVNFYSERYAHYKTLYPLLQSTFHYLSKPKNG